MNNIKWSAIYMEFADKLLEYKNNRKELIEKIYKIHDDLNIELTKLYVDDNGNSVIPKDIDPFTIFGLFNKGISKDKRINILSKIKSEFNLSSDIPKEFDGVPILNNLSSAFYLFDNTAKKCINNIWEFYEIALSYSKSSNEYYEKFINGYNKVLSQKRIKWNLSMALFWIRPYIFINLDSTNREFLSLESNLSKNVSDIINSLKNPPKGETYLKICNECQSALKNNNFNYTNFVELSNYAYFDNYEDLGMGDENIETTKYWLYAPGKKANMWDEFYREGIMAIDWKMSDLNNFNSKEEIREALKKYYNDNKNHYNDVLALWQFLNEIQIGDVIFVKKGIKKILGRGIVESNYIYDKNRNNYKHIRKIKWIDKGEWDIDENLNLKTLTDYTNYKNIVNKINSFFDEEIPDNPINYPLYTNNSFLNEVYMDEKKYNILTELLITKKNIIIQGAPGVGKTFIAKRLAYSIMGCKDVERVMMVQFHQSYSYEDFVMGYRPSKDGFELKHGSFYNFCKKAEDDDENDYFFIIDEINRGNISKIFGELFMLIEKDKRGQKNKIQLLYSDETFSIPKNIHIIGLMNTADRSLAMIDFALRRRFVFFDLKPGFDNNNFKKYQNKIDNRKFDKIIIVIKELNDEIGNDENLGEGFKIGHSFFCNLESNDQLNYIIEYEIIPLLNEYWFDEKDKVNFWCDRFRDILR